MKLLNLSGYAIRCWGYRGSIISHPNLANPTSSCIHPSTHNREKLRKPSTSTFEKASVIQVMAILPNSRPSIGWRRGYLTNELHKRDFQCRRTKLRYFRTDKIVTTTPRSSTPRDTATTPKCQEAPRTMFSSQNHRNDSKIPV